MTKRNLGLRGCPLGEWESFRSCCHGNYGAMLCAHWAPASLLTSPGLRSPRPASLQCPLRCVCVHPRWRGRTSWGQTYHTHPRNAFPSECLEGMVASDIFVNRTACTKGAIQSQRPAVLDFSANTGSSSHDCIVICMLLQSHRAGHLKSINAFQCPVSGDSAPLLRPSLSSMVALRALPAVLHHLFWCGDGFPHAPPPCRGA